MFSIDDAKIFFQQALLDLYEASESDEIFARLIDDLTQQDRLQWKLTKKQLIARSTFEKYVAQLQQQIPLQYVLGYEWFGDIKLKVNQDVLIPRPESYELALWVIEKLKTKSEKLQILDIGTGSGCLPIYLAKYFPQHHYTALDVSKNALVVAASNALEQQVEIKFIQQDILDSSLHVNPLLDFIISNPPYILPAEMQNMQAQVRNHEPHEALFVSNNDPLQFYKAIKRIADKNRSKSLEVFLEVHQDYAEAVKILFEESNYKVALRMDIYKHPRMINASRN